MNNYRKKIFMIIAGFVSMPHLAFSQNKVELFQMEMNSKKFVLIADTIGRKIASPAFPTASPSEVTDGELHLTAYPYDGNSIDIGSSIFITSKLTPINKGCISFHILAATSSMLKIFCQRSDGNISLLSYALTELEPEKRLKTLVEKIDYDPEILAKLDTDRVWEINRIFKITNGRIISLELKGTRASDGGVGVVDLYGFLLGSNKIKLFMPHEISNCPSSLRSSTFGDKKATAACNTVQIIKDDTLLAEVSLGAKPSSVFQHEIRFVADNELVVATVTDPSANQMTFYQIKDEGSGWTLKKSFNINVAGLHQNHQLAMVVYDSNKVGIALSVRDGVKEYFAAIEVNISQGKASKALYFPSDSTSNKIEMKYDSPVYIIPISEKTVRVEDISDNFHYFTYDNSGFKESIKSELATITDYRKILKIDGVIITQDSN